MAHPIRGRRARSELGERPLGVGRRRQRAGRSRTWEYRQVSQDAAFDRLAAVVLEDPSVVVARAVQMARDALGMEVAYLAELNDSEQCFGDVAGDGSAVGVVAQGRMPRS